MGASWKRIGRILRPFWGHLGNLGAFWEGLWTASAKNPFFISKFSAPGRGTETTWGILRGILGASWARLGAILEPSWEAWSDLGTSWGRVDMSWGRLEAHFIAHSTWKRIVIDLSSIFTSKFDPLNL